jgi:hypothetical protein
MKVQGGVTRRLSNNVRSLLDDRLQGFIYLRYIRQNQKDWEYCNRLTGLRASPWEDLGHEFSSPQM